jgi:hypothetical protein
MLVAGTSCYNAEVHGVRPIGMAVLLGFIAACSGGSNDVCTTDPNRSPIQCTPTDAGVGCLGRDLGYADDNIYRSCEAPRQGDTSTCATLYSCDVDGGSAQWRPVVGF